jgi:hypothetical protein
MKKLMTRRFNTDLTDYPDYNLTLRKLSIDDLLSLKKNQN